MSYKVALHCTDREPLEVNSLATAVAGALTTNLTTFALTAAQQAALTANIATLNTANGKLSGYIANAPGNHAIVTLRDKQTIIVYNMLNTIFRVLVDGIAAGDKTLIELSGFDASADPVPHGIPNTPLISKITDTKQAAGEAKIILVKSKKKSGTGTTTTKKRTRSKYSAQTTAAPTTASSVWINAIESVSSRDLILTHLVKGNEIDVRVRAEDGKLKSPWSAPVSFLPRTSAPGIPTTKPTTGTAPAGG